MEVDRLLSAGKATVNVLTSKDKWFGVTYKEDKPYVQASIQALKDAGVYYLATVDGGGKFIPID